MSKCKFTDNEGYISSHTDVRRSQNSSGDGGGGNKRKIREGGKLDLQKRNKPNPDTGRASSETSASFQESLN